MPAKEVKGDAVLSVQFITILMFDDKHQGRTLHLQRYIRKWVYT